MTLAKEDINCPCCNKIVKTTSITSQYILSYKTDLRCVGQCRSTPMINKCKKCKYIFFDATIKINKISLNAYLKSDEYLYIHQKYNISKPFIVIHNIYKFLNKPFEDNNLLLLYNYYYTSDIDDLKELVKHYKIFIKNYTDKKVDADYIFANMLMGEYYRRISNFEDSREIFLKIKNIHSNFEHKYINMCNFQLKLIKMKNTSLETYYDLSPNLEQKIPLLDENKTFKSDEYINDLFYTLILPLHETHRYDDFSKALSKLQDFSVNLKTSDLISSLLSLFTRINGVAAKDKILEMIKISLFEYDAFEILYDEDGTIISDVKYYLWNDYKIEINDILDELREYYLQYILINFNNKNISSLSKSDQHILLLMQLPYYSNVKSLLEIGLRFDKEFDYKNRYEDILGYIEDVSIGPEYGDFYKKDFVDIYKLLSLVIEQSFDIEEKRKIFEKINEFAPYLSIEEIEQLKFQVTESLGMKLNVMELFEEKDEITIINLINSGDIDIDLNIDDENLIVIATEYACTNVVNLLIDLGISINTKNRRGDDLLTIACSNSLKFFQFIEDKGLELNELNVNDILVKVIRSEQYESLFYILNKGVDINIDIGSSGYKGSLIHLMYGKQDQTIIKILINSGLNINSVDSRGNTLLHKVMYGVIDINFFEFLVDNGADVNLENSNGDTALDLLQEYVEFEVNQIEDSLSNILLKTRL